MDAKRFSMDTFLRILVYILIGFLLLMVNFWFIQTVYQTLISPRFVIAPFQTIGQSSDEQRYGETLAIMLSVRLGQLQRTLQATHTSTSQQPLEGVEQTTVTTLFIPQPVDIPTGFLKPVDLDVAVAGVEIGGLLPWMQELLSKPRTLTFTVQESGDKVIVTGDLKGFVRSVDPDLWFESEKQPDEIVTNIAYALIQKRLAENHNEQIAALDLADFRVLLDSILRVEKLNEKVRQKHRVDDEFAALLPDIERLNEKIPQWYELMYFTATVAESSGNRQKAIQYYRKLEQELKSPQASALLPNPRLANLVNEKLKILGVGPELTLDDKQRNFIEASRGFARLMAVTGPEPMIVFKKQDFSGVQALWKSETRQYEVNPDFIDLAGLPQSVALMGRFLEKNYDRCGGAGSMPVGTREYWNEFRLSVVGYLVQSVPEFSEVTNNGADRALYAALKKMEAQSPTKDAVQRLALEMLNRYDCDWDRNNLEQKVLEINQERGLLPAKVIQDALSSMNE